MPHRRTLCANVSNIRLNHHHITRRLTSNLILKTSGIVMALAVDVTIVCDQMSLTLLELVMPLRLSWARTLFHFDSRQAKSKRYLHRDDTTGSKAVSLAIFWPRGRLDLLRSVSSPIISKTNSTETKSWIVVSVVYLHYLLDDAEKRIAFTLCTTSDCFLHDEFLSCVGCFPIFLPAF